MESLSDHAALDHATARALLEWQVELGADEAILDAPLNRYDLAEALPRTAAAVAVGAGSATRAAPPPLPDMQVVDPVAVAHAAAGAATDIAGLRAALGAFAHCDFRLGAKNLVFADGDVAARVMILTEPPDRAEDLAGLPFAGPAGALLDRMLAAIGMGRAHPDPARAVYVATVLPWRPPASHVPDDAVLAMMRPFVARHVALAQPDILIAMGNTACRVLLGQGGVTRLRGTWAEAEGRPVLPMVHPADIGADPAARRDAWADLLALQARLFP